MTPSLHEYFEKARSSRRSFLNALGEAHAWQERVLRECVSANAGTAFGVEHGFASIQGPEDFRRAVPIRRYEELRPWIERAVAGERNMLTTEDPALFFSSSGSTGDHKYVPVTRSFMEKCFLPFLYAALGNFVEHYPESVERSDATLNLKWDPERSVGQTVTGKPHLGASQVDIPKVFGAAQAWEPGAHAPWARIPRELPDDRDRMYYRIRLALQHDVRALIGINPSMISALADLLARRSEELIRDVRDGTVLGRPLGSPDARRAGELESLERYFGVLRPAHVWPRLQVIYCWTGGLAGLYLPHLRASFGPDVQVLPAPLAASEGPIGLPIDRHATAGPLVVSSVFYEFIDADEDVGPESRTLWAHELKPGGEYHVILTQPGGLYRYSVGDVVRVVDTVHGVARVEYGGRRDVSSLAGERLRESHVVSALHQSLQETGLSVRNATCRALEEAPPAYAFAVEPFNRWTPEEAKALVRALDASLRRASPRYAELRQAGRLGDLQLHVVEPETFAQQWDRRVAGGVRPAQAKDRVFQRDPSSWAELLRRTLFTV